MEIVHAAVDWTATGCIKEEAATIQCLEPLFRSLVQGIVAIMGVALFIMLVIGGFKFLLSGGDQKKLEQAKHTLTYAITGVIVIVSAYLILKTVQVFTGVDVTKFTIPK